MVFGLVMQALMAWLVFTLGPEPQATAVTGAVRPYEISDGDTLTSVGARFGVEPRTLAKDNDLRRTHGCARATG